MTDFSTLPAVGDAAMPVNGGRFYRPPLPAGYVYRPRLCERLRAGLGGRLLLVSAPAGFGKSSLAIEFCESLGPQWRSLWLGVSARDGDPGASSNACWKACASTIPTSAMTPWRC
jgi:LuxR family maltose regulon positive regulatory protein